MAIVKRAGAMATSAFLLCCSLILNEGALAQNSPAPDTLNYSSLLAPGEAVYVTKSGCRVIYTVTAQSKVFYGAKLLDWSGPCRSGFAHGRGWLQPAESIAKVLDIKDSPSMSEFRFGRLAPVVAHRQPYGGLMMTYFSAKRLTNLVLVRIGEDLIPSMGNSSNWGSSVTTPTADGGWAGVSIQGTSCNQRPGLTSVDERRAFADCQGPDDHAPVFFVQVSHGSDPDSEIDERFYCPTPNTPVGCDAVWQNHFAPYRAEAKKVIAETREAEKILESALRPKFEAWEKAHR